MATFSDLFTHTRASTATYTDANGILQTAAINEPRTNSHYWNGSAWVKGYQHESEARTNLVLNSDTLATQSRTVTAVPHTLHFVGTGTVTLSGASTAGPLVGTGTGENNRVNLTFTPTAGTLTLTVTGSVTFAQLEAASTPSSYIPTAGATVTRAADVMTLPIANIPYPDPVVIGPELVTNGTFDSDISGWTGARGNETLSIVSGELLSTATVATAYGATSSLGVVPAGIYQISAYVSAGAGNTSSFFRVSPTLDLSNTTVYNVGLGAGANTANISTVIVLPSAIQLYVGCIGVAGSIGNTISIDNISVREINPLAVSIAMDGVMTYADMGLDKQLKFIDWRLSSAENIEINLTTVSTFTGRVDFRQIAASVADNVLLETYSPGVNVPFSIASRHGSTFINGAVDGTALTADLTPVSFPNLSATNMSIAPTFNGFIHKFRMWGDTTGDIGDIGIAEASAT